MGALTLNAKMQWVPIITPAVSTSINFAKYSTNC